MLILTKNDPEALDGLCLFCVCVMLADLWTRLNIKRALSVVRILTLPFARMKRQADAGWMGRESAKREASAGLAIIFRKVKVQWAHKCRRESWCFCTIEDCNPWCHRTCKRRDVAFGLACWRSCRCVVFVAHLLHCGRTFPTFHSICTVRYLTVL